MADSCSRRGKCRIKKISQSRANKGYAVKDMQIQENEMSNKTKGKKKGRPKTKSHDIQETPVMVAFSQKLIYPCCYCDVAFASNCLLEKHKNWKHTQPVPVPPSPLAAQGQRRTSKKRATVDANSCARNPKQVKMDNVSAQCPENGECAAESQRRGDKPSVPSAATSSCRDSKQESSHAAVPEEDPERMRHRRKQKTPKKFTGEQPSISGTFGLKGLAKVEDRAKANRANKAERKSCMQEVRRKAPESVMKKDSASYSSAFCTQQARRRDGEERRSGLSRSIAVGSVEERWQREISERGMVTCPNCDAVTRKTIAGLCRHMDVCQKLRDALKCRQCNKQFKSKAGLNYHTMAEHSNKPAAADVSGLSEHKERERLRKVLKQLGKLKCPREGCSATFSSLMGYQYHLQRCGKEISEVEKPVFTCSHCSKMYKSKAGHDYHVRSEHTAPVEEPARKPEVPELEDFERTPSGRIRRRSAQVAVFHLQEIAEDELAKDWTKRRMKDDLVPDTKQLNYTRPGLPDINPRVLENWKNDVKEHGHISCPNHHCEAQYSSVSGLKAHLANCTKGNPSIGKYRCLLCLKEFSSESGVKYHIIRTHAQNWFRTSSGATTSKKKQEPVSSVEKRSKYTPGKKRGRKPKERPPETPVMKRKENTVIKTNKTVIIPVANFPPKSTASNSNKTTAVINNEERSKSSSRPPRTTGK
ncbi:zinc finger protein 512B isoform X2 [Microcaecilia unicolor]|uniref:Zinc finger protein 512B isoform X2 n=1 Tax=Microcaecilia unicolor TaxID=1415580 RepID=A0A6P7YUF4_9AMPH|nr:zinc finger protein 512B isoform X2 [Microcaecilia unicolor]